MLNGIGVHQELGKEQFIGALFSESLSNDSKTLLATNQPMRMELKIVSDSLTTRRFSRMWIEGMAINNPADILTAQADNMVKFDGLFKGRFQPNDYIVFTNTPGKGVDITVNGVLLGNIKDNQFFSLLLSTWIGKIPLSSDYRDSLLKVGDVDKVLRGRFDSIKPASARIAEVSGWASSKADEQKVTDAKSGAKSSAPATVVTTVEKPKADAQTKVPAEKTPVAATANNDSDNEPALTAQSLLARQFYVSDMLKKIFNKTTYPARALERSQTGNVRIGVVVDRRGNVISTNVLEESKFDLLNKEAVNAIKRSSPFPEMPAAIPGDQFEFTVPIKFTLPKKQ